MGHNNAELLSFGGDGLTECLVWHLVRESAEEKHLLSEGKRGICTLLHFPPDFGARDADAVSSSFPSPSLLRRMLKCTLVASTCQLAHSALTFPMVGSTALCGLSGNIQEAVSNNYQFLGGPQAVGMLQKHIQSPIFPRGIIKHALDSTGF